MAPTGYSMTVNMDASNLCKVTKANGIKFFPAYLWLVTKKLNKQIENRMPLEMFIVFCIRYRLHRPPLAARFYWSSFHSGS